MKKLLHGWCKVTGMGHFKWGYSLGKKTKKHNQGLSLNPRNKVTGIGYFQWSYCLKKQKNQPRSFSESMNDEAQGM